MKLRNIKSKRTVKAVERMGFRKLHQSGTHVILQGEINGIKKTVSIPVHKDEIPVGTLTDIINNQLGITRKEFFKHY